MSVGVFVMVAENIVVIRKMSSYGAWPIFFVAFVLTARRYNLVGVTRRKHRAPIPVPRASGARKLSRCKEGMAHFLPSRYKFYLALRVSRYK